MTPSPYPPPTTEGRNAVGGIALINVLLAVAWMLLSTQFTPGNFFAGLVLGFLVLRFGFYRGSTQRYLNKMLLAIRFVLFFTRELLQANLSMARLVLEMAVRGSSPRLSPGIVAVPLYVKSDLAITVLANLITLTPGTLALSVSDDRTMMYVHSVTVDPNNLDAFRSAIHDGLERRVWEVFEA